MKWYHPKNSNAPETAIGMHKIGFLTMLEELEFR